jgi:hypothetical protein
MISKKSLLTSAALTGLLLTAGCAHYDGGGGYAGGTHAALGQCHGVNACKGKGDCGGKTNEYAGENSCEGKGWVKMSKSMCSDIKNSAWKPMPKKA